MHPSEESVRFTTDLDAIISNSFLLRSNLLFNHLYVFLLGLILLTFWLIRFLLGVLENKLNWRTESASRFRSPLATIRWPCLLWEVGSMPIRLLLFIFAKTFSWEKFFSFAFYPQNIRKSEKVRNFPVCIFAHPLQTGYTLPPPICKLPGRGKISKSDPPGATREGAPWRTGYSNY